MRITIDGKEIEAREGQSVLDAALEAGVYIPHLCSHPDLEAKGGCRLCSVEIEGNDKAVPSCETKAVDGMVISINGPKADKVRRASMELILATHPADCTGCPKYGKCELQSMYQYMGVSPQRWRNKSRSVPNNESNPLISHLFTRCVRCGRCIRGCNDVRGVGVLEYIKTDVGIHAGIKDGMSLEEAGCRFCGACVELCPTGSIVDSLNIMKDERSYADNVVPCRDGCPAHIDIPRYIRHIKNGEFGKATAVVREKVPFPEALGSICSHACESQCKRGALKNPVSICKLKRAAAVMDDEKWKANSKKEESTGKKVGIIGGGPGGLTAAFYLAKKGHDVTVFEKNEKLGGQCRYGIPSYRLPDEVMDKEIGYILEQGVKVELSKTAYANELMEQGYDSVLISVGTNVGTRLPLPGNDLPQVHVNADFLKQARMNNPLPVGKRVMVLGGGNVAYDCARTALRVGAEQVYVACLENRDQMTATIDEIEEGFEEGIELLSANSFSRIVGEDKVEGVELQEVEKFYFDENRKAVIDLKEGTKRVVPVDTVIFAVGQRPEETDKMGVDLTHGPYVAVNENLETSLPGVYACGDVVTGTKSVIDAIAGGRRAAEAIDLYLGGNGDISEELVEHEVGSPFIGKMEDFYKLDRVKPKLSDGQTRKHSFELVEFAYTCEEAQKEAERCLQCDLRLNLTKPKLWNEY